ncbi:MAG TPA: TonB-dependent receptor [Terracidiphilus sp.]|nr:TonB-dependent receptor [Terracidiphilus sp.]
MRNFPFLRTVFALVAGFAFVLALSPFAHAQDVASITGVVTDSTGALVPGAAVTLQNTTTGAAYKGITNSEGSYIISSVLPGPGYTLTISHAGFNSAVITGMYLNVNATRTQNATLLVGNTTQTVEVSAEAQTETINTTDATIGNNFQVSLLNDLPVQNRDSPAALFYQQPGVTLSGAVTGARTDQSNVTVDGLEMNDNATGQFGTIVSMAPVDSVQEFRAVVGNPLAGSGQGGGGQFELVTRSGTNSFHGALVEYHRDTDTEANDWFNNNAGVGRPPLVRNQFGGNIGGPIWRNKAFFFFDYDGRRDARSILVDRTVPLGTNTSGYRGGQLAYVNIKGAVVTLNSSQVAALDPQGIGWDQAELKLFQSRYPAANDLTGAVGDGVNTAGFRFNAPNPYVENVYVQRVDYTLNDKMKLFGKANVARRNALENAIQFPGDPTYTYPFYDRSYDWTVGHTWTINQDMINQAQIGETFEDFNFSVTYNPQGANQYSFTGLSRPYGDGSNSQARAYPIPIVRDDFTWIRGRHSFSFGGTFKWETPNDFAAENYNFPSVGVTGNTNFIGLNDSLRPDDIDPLATQIYDNAFSTALGAFADVSSKYDYNNKGQVLKQGSGQSFNYRNYESEIYFSDTWKLTPDLTLTYGLRYQNYTVPYETTGKEAVPQLTSGNFSFDTYWADRLKQSAAGTSTDSALPFLQYIYGGPANHAPGYFQPQNKNFAPRIGFAWNPGFDKDTVITASGSLVYDHSIINALQFQQLQTSGLFEASNSNLFGTAGDPYGSLSSSSPADGGLPRFGGINSPPPAPAPPTITTPYTPYVYKGFGYGLPYGEFNIVMDPHLKTPYNLEYNLGFQHQFPHGLILKMNYASRLGRRLLAQVDSAQVLDFPDNTGGSNQTMVQAYAAMETQLRQYSNLSAYRAATHLSPQPWFEDMAGTFAQDFNASFGGNYFANNTQAIAYITAPYPARGDIGDDVYYLALLGYLPPNAGMPTQYASNTVWTNKGFSTYNGLLVTLHKNAGHGLQFDLNYTWSHSIDNVSTVANFIAGSNGFGFLCDITRPRECRGNSDFDVTNYFNGNFIYELPFGRGRTFGANAPLWVNEAVGGWELSGIPTWHTGLAYNATSNAYVASFANNAPATLIGSPAILKARIHGGEGQPLLAFSDSPAARQAFAGPIGLDIGSRNNLRGPGFFNVDLGLGKTFPLYGDKVNLKFRCDAFNALNHPNFAYPGQTVNGVVTGSSDITQSNGVPFGTIGATVGSPGSDLASRVLQGSLRLEF